MTNSKDKFYVVRTSLVRKAEQEIWRTILIPSSFSLLQLHVVLQDLYGWRETSGSFHYFSHGKMEQKPHFNNEDLQECRLSDENPEVVYQTVYPEECDGWVKQIGPGLYIEHTHPHDPAPLFSVNHELSLANDELTTRILRDERLYKVHHVFDVFPHLIYEFDHGLNSFPSFRLLLSFEETIVSTPEDFSTDYSLLPVIIDGQGECSSPFEKQEKFHLASLQRRLNNSHRDHKQGGIEKCYLCHRFEFDCPKLGSQCTLYTSETCCAYCIGNPALQNLEPYDQNLSMLAWNQGIIALNSERAKFLEALTNGDGFQCNWVESDGRRCGFCHNINLHN